MERKKRGDPQTKELKKKRRREEEKKEEQKSTVTLAYRVWQLYQPCKGAFVPWRGRVGCVRRVRCNEHEERVRWLPTVLQP